MNKYTRPTFNISLILTILLFGLVAWATGNIVWAGLLVTAVCPLTMLAVVFVLMGVMK